MSLTERRRVNLNDYDLTTTLGTGMSPCAVGQPSHARLQQPAARGELCGTRYGRRTGCCVANE